MQILNQIKEIETEFMKMSKISDFIDRIIDVDILFFNEEVIVGENVCIPHPLLHLRNFCIKPFCDINPDYLHPVFGLKMKEIFDIDESGTQSVCYMEKMKFTELLDKNL